MNSFNKRTISIIHECQRYNDIKMEKPDMKQYHFCNYAVDKILAIKRRKQDNGVFELCRFDNNTDFHDAYQSIKATANLIGFMMPGKWVLIDTGDEFTLDPENETYDHDYALILVHIDIFSQFKKALKRVDKEWRGEKERLLLSS